MHPGLGAGVGEPDEQVAVRHGVHGVLRDLRPPLLIDEAELPRRELTIDGQCRARNGPGAQRTPVRLRRHLRQPRAVALQHLDPGKQVVGEIHRLGPLQMRVARNQHVTVLLRHG